MTSYLWALIVQTTWAGLKSAFWKWHKPRRYDIIRCLWYCWSTDVYANRWMTSCSWLTRCNGPYRRLTSNSPEVTTRPRVCAKWLIRSRSFPRRRGTSCVRYFVVHVDQCFVMAEYTMRSRKLTKAISSFFKTTMTSLLSSLMEPSLIWRLTYITIMISYYWACAIIDHQCSFEGSAGPFCNGTTGLIKWKYC